MTGKNFAYIIVATFSLVLSFIYRPVADLFFDDKEIFKYTGFLIKKGLVPYKDFFDHKPPLLYFLNYFGLLMGKWGFWIIDSCLVLFAALAFLKLNTRFKIAYPFVLPILFLLILRNSTISFGMGMSREYTTIFLLLLVCAVLTPTRFKYYYIGFLTGLIFFMQQDQVVIAFPFLIYTLLREHRFTRQMWRSLLSMFLGSLLVTIPVLAYFAFNNALLPFWQDAFLFNLQWYTSPEDKPGLLQEVSAIKDLIFSVRFEVLLFGTLLLALLSLFIGTKAKWLLITSLLTIPLSFISEFLSGKIAIKDALCNYYILPLAVTLPFTLFVVFAFTKSAVFKNKWMQLFYCSLFLFGPLWNIVAQQANAHRYPQDYMLRTPEIQYLDKAPPSDYQLYVFNNANYCIAYNRYQILMPSKWLYHHFWSWYPDWDSDHIITQSIIEDLKKYKTRYIINFPIKNQMKDGKNQQAWNDFLNAYYRQLAPLQLWELKQ
jgi:hypothetical protein